VKAHLNPVDAKALLLSHLYLHLPDRREELLALSDSLTALGMSIEVKKTSPKHTDDQRGFYWQSLKWWGNEMGYSAKESEYWIHNAVCCEAFGVAGEKRFYGVSVEIPEKTSSKLDRDDYSKLIDTMLRLAAEDGITIPDAERIGT